MSKKKVIILGASRYQTKGIEAAKNAGYYIIALDRNPESVGFASADEGIVCDISDQESVLKIALTQQVSGIVAINDTGVPVAAYVASKLGLPGITPEVAELSSNKELMRKVWLEKGIPCPKVFVATTPEEFKKGFEYIGFPCILKPAHGLGGASRGVIVVHNPDETQAAITFTQSFYEDKTTLIESFIDAQYEHSAEVLIYNGKVSVIAISDKIKTPLPYRVDKNVLYPTVINGQQLEQLKKTIIESVIALGINNGAAHVELATTSSGFYLFELGARCGGGGTAEPIVHYATGINEFVEVIRILAGDEPKQLTPICNRGANYHFLTPESGTLKEVSGMDDLLNMPGILDAEFFKKPGEFIPEVKVGTERSGFIIAVGETREEAYRNGVEAEKKLQITLQ